MAWGDVPDQGVPVMRLKDFLENLTGDWRVTNGFLMDDNAMCPLQSVADYMDLLFDDDDEMLAAGDCGRAMGLPDELSWAIMGAADNQFDYSETDPDNIRELRRVLLDVCQPELFQPTGGES